MQAYVNQKSNLPPQRRVSAHELEKSLRATVMGEVRLDPGTLALYTTDASNYRQVPLGVVIPKTVEDVINTVAVCRRFELPLLSRGGGTALAGQTCNNAIIIDFSKYLNHILEIDTEKKQARIEPGCILDHLRNEASKNKLTFGPDPSTHDHNTLGGMIGNNSCGVHSVMAGKTEENVMSLDILTYDGLRMEVGPTPDDELNRIIGEKGRKGEIYRGLQEIRDQYANLIRNRYPDIPRRVSGYNLNELLPENDFNVARALVGTESTCVVVLHGTVRLVYSPPYRSLLVLGYPDIYHAADHIMEIMGYKPLGLEAIDDKLVHFMHLKKLHLENLDLLPAGNGWLLAEFGGESQEEAHRIGELVIEKLKKTEKPPAMKLYYDKEEEHEVWKIRESGLGATANIPGLPYSWPGWEDSAVAPDKLGLYLRDFRDLLNRFGYIASLYGHFGQGCLHCRISFDLRTQPGIEHYMKFIDHAADLVIKYCGSLSGEHGDGQSRAALLTKMYGPELVTAFGKFKHIWDPSGKMNPGKIVDPFLPDQNLRLGVNYRPWEPKTQYAYPDDDGSFSEASLRCVGVGECRRIENAFMCPSFLVTREERHTTRGRARTIFEMLQKDVIKAGWKSKGVSDALEYCLECKGCKKECPVNVDMATYKSEFQYHHFKGRMRPLSHYVIGMIGYWAPFAYRMSGFSNFMTQKNGLGNFTKRICGLAVERPLPQFYSLSFTQWYKNQLKVTKGPRKDNWQQGQKKVVLFPDVYNNYFDPLALIQACYIMENWGYQVFVPPGRIGSVQALLHYGMLNKAKKELARILQAFRPYLENGTPIVFLEPSDAAVFRDDTKNLIPHDQDGLRFRRLTYLLSEFIVEKDLPVPQMHGKAILHAHCHQKAVLHIKDIHKILKKMDIDYEEPQMTCCGLAGPFGFEKKHYDLSMKVGELHLLPAVRAASKDTWLVAEGFSCRKQIEDGTGRDVMHLSELIYRGMHL